MFRELLKSSRLKSLLWRAAMMAVAAFLTVIANGVGDLEIAPQVTTVVGLVLGEISKAINNRYGRSS